MRVQRFYVSSIRPTSGRGNICRSMRPKITLALFIQPYVSCAKKAID